MLKKVMKLRAVCQNDETTTALVNSLDLQLKPPNDLPL